MPLDKPAFPGEAEINLQAATLTSSGCTGPALAVDDDPATAAIFGPPAFLPGAGIGAAYYAGVTHAQFLAGGGVPQSIYPGLPTATGLNTGFDNSFTAGTPFDPLAPYGIIWTGYFVPRYSELYTFATYFDDQARIFINDVQMLPAVPETGNPPDVFNNAQTFTMALPLAAGTPYKIRVEYYSDGVPAAANTIQWQSASQPQQVIPTASLYPLPPTPQPRFLRVDWGYDAFISRIRLAYDGPGAANVGVDYESSLSYAEGQSPPTDIALSSLPVPVDGQVHEIVFSPPVLGRGAVFYPDALLFSGASSDPAPSGQSVNLYEIEVYQDVTQGVFPMSKPSVNQARVGCSGAVITPRASNIATTYPFPQALASVLQSIQSLNFGTTSKLARETGGDTVHQVNGWETDRETKLKFSVERYDYLALQNLQAGTLVVNAANQNVGETQYIAPGYGDRNPYFSLVAQSVNGDPSALLVFPKCKIDGNLAQNLERDKTSVLEVDIVLFWDFNYTRQDGTLGGIYEQVFTNGGPVGLHS